jgi:hypothetical protein
LAGLSLGRIRFPDFPEVFILKKSIWPDTFRDRVINNRIALQKSVI